MKRVLALCFCLMVLCTACSADKEVSEQKQEIVAGEETISGIYTGYLSNGKPDGAGYFLFEDGEASWSYEGEFTEGKITGQGTYDNKPYDCMYGDTQFQGTYSGTVIDGVPEGEGEYRSETEGYDFFTYTGGWKDGVFHGNGTLQFDEEQYYTRKGTYENGRFTPSVAELYETLGTSSYASYKIVDNAKNFLEDNSEWFPSSGKADLLKVTNTNLEYRKIVKTPEQYGDELIKQSNLYVVQVYEEEVFGYTLTEMICEDPEWNVYHIFYLDTIDVYVGDTVTFCGLPLATAFYESVDGTDIESIKIAACYFE